MKFTTAVSLIIFALILVFILTFLFFISRFFIQFQDQQIEHLRQRAQGLINGINAHLFRFLQELRMTYFTYLQTHAPGDPGFGEDMSLWFDSLIAESIRLEGEYTYTWLGFISGTSQTDGTSIVISESDEEGVSLAAFANGRIPLTLNSLIPIPENEDFSVGSPFFDENAQILVVPVAARNRTPSGEEYVLLADFNLNKLLDAHRSGIESEVYTVDIILNETGQIVHSTRPYRPFQPLKDTRYFAPEMEEFIRSGSGPLGPETGISGGMVGTDFMYAIAITPEISRSLGWRAISLTEWDEILAPTIIFRRNMILIGSAISVAIIIFSVLFYLFVKRALGHLEDGVEMFGRGHFQWRIPPNRMLEFDELGRLLNSMADQLNKNTTSITKLEDEISAREFAESQLRNSYQSLELINEELHQFAYVVSHDLKQPLRNVYSFIPFLLEEIGDDISDDARTYLNLISSGASKMKDIIDDLLTYTRVDSRGREFTSISALGVFNEALQIFKPDLTQLDAKIITGTDVMVQADEKQIYLVFQNLISNAIKYRSASKRLTIELICEEQGSKARIIVRDNGIGIKPEYAERIFQLFQRLNQNRAVEGTGLGLAIVKKIIDRHNGSIALESQFGCGSSFEITLPLGTEELG